MRTPDRGLLDWLTEPAPDRGLRFATPGGSWDYQPYPQLAKLSLRAAAALTRRGLGDGDVVAIIQRCGPAFVGTLFGAQAAGATPCSVAPPLAFQPGADYQRHLTHVLRTAQPKLIVTDSQSHELVESIAEQTGRAAVVRFADLITGTAPTDRIQPARIALLQFTSGSSGFSRAVRIPLTALNANINAISSWLEYQPGDPGASWLPMHHDMGLIGNLFTPVVHQGGMWMFQPEDFIRSPLRYLACLSNERISLTSMPAFGLEYILRRITPDDLAGLRFDALRTVILGAERIDADLLRSFTSLVEPHGFRHTALRPAYGSAEATLAVTGLPVAEEWSVSRPDGAGLGPMVVGCGRPLRGVTVTVVDGDGMPVPDGRVGEIVVTGENIADGYLGDPGTASRTSLGARVLRSGDAGFLRQGQLFVLGRLGDGMKVRGQMVFAESLETAAARSGVPFRRMAVLLGHRDGQPAAAVICENPQPHWPELLARVLAEQLPDIEPDLIAVPSGGIARTTSGKPKRRLMWQQYCDGTVAGAIRPLRAS